MHVKQGTEIVDVAKQIKLYTKALTDTINNLSTTKRIAKECIKRMNSNYDIRVIVQKFLKIIDEKTQLRRNSNLDDKKSSDVGKLRELG